ncbi:hypothetical protein WN55_10856 [Dufourea novaeangliae]|uniref:Uncharacterized protein n=1 Tax=Dufourea novaeangliae TaxID=178035 RepID=A0A154PBB6_DUFNO|nr:hypothetical protein WN55_10856 [Dufourea novaeangliae]
MENGNTLSILENGVYGNINAEDIPPSTLRTPLRDYTARLLANISSATYRGRRTV